MKRAIITVFLAIFLSQSISFIYPYQVFKKTSPEESENRWKSILKEYPVTENAIELERKFSFPSKDLEKKGYYFHSPQFIEHDSSGNIFVSDSAWCRIAKFDSSGTILKTFGQAGQGPGDLSYPKSFFITNDNKLVVNEIMNRRFQFFDTEGKHLKILKMYKDYLSLVLNDKGLIFAIPRSFSKQDKPHLIEVLDQEGKELRSFGKPLNFKYDITTNNESNLAINNKGELFVAFLYHPISRKYSQKGELLAEYRINHNYKNRSEKRNLNNQSLLAKCERVGYATILNSIKAFDENFYILLNYPRLEILEFDSNGNLIKNYWTTQTWDYYAEYFLVQHRDNKKYFYILQTDPEVRVDVFGIKKN